MPRGGNPVATAVKCVLVPLATGFEEVEAVAIVDVLRRAELPVTVAGLSPSPVVGSHGIGVATDGELGALDLSRVDALVLPGGMPGTTALMADERLIALIQRLVAAGRPVAALCAAPRVLHRAGVLEGLEVTAHPSARRQLTGAQVRDEPRVVVARGAGGGAVVTSQGPGTALEFALELVSQWVSPARAEELRAAMLVSATGAPARGPRG
jgi:4-methyl-5(b-hydroxyethyl)-thiazole monophosphate biosynthesis